MLIDCGECSQVEHKESLLAGKALAETELKRTQEELAEEQQKRKTVEEERASFEERGVYCRAFMCAGGHCRASCVSCMHGRGCGLKRLLASGLASVCAMCIGRVPCRWWDDCIRCVASFLIVSLCHASGARCREWR